MDSAPWIAAIISLLGVSIFFLLFQQKQYSPRKGKKERHIALAFKGLATLFTVALAVYGAVLTPTAGHILLAMGLFVCAAADVLLGMKLLYGVAAFALGHGFYCAAFWANTPIGWLNILIFVLCFGACACFLFPKIKKGAGDKPVWPFMAYGAILFFMMSMAVTQTPLLLAGAMLFVISDCMLSFRLFMNNRSVVFDYVCLGAYYLAQYLIALSVLI